MTVGIFSIFSNVEDILNLKRSTLTLNVDN
jgi:hypothetical protein